MQTIWFVVNKLIVECTRQGNRYLFMPIMAITFIEQIYSFFTEMYKIKDYKKNYKKTKKRNSEQMARTE
jgi:hypothetical protein